MERASIIKKLFSIYDKKTRSFDTVVTESNEQNVYRGIHQALQTKSTLSQYPDDFEIYQLGSMDMETGEVESIWPPKLLHSVKAIAEIFQAGEEEQQQ